MDDCQSYIEVVVVVGVDVCLRACECESGVMRVAKVKRRRKEERDAEG